MIRQSDEQIARLLQEELALLEQSIDTLRLSLDKCTSIGIKNVYSFEESESIDSLTSKFGRTSDIFVQKVLRTIWMQLHESFIPFIDFMNKAEKMELISSADQMIEIRDLRNQIAHEYLPDAIQQLLPEVLEKVGILMSNIQMTKEFLKSRG